jgi:hypothetical protein
MFYVYQLSSLSYGVFYIGKGKGNRMYRHSEIARGNSINRKTNIHLYNRILKIIQSDEKLVYKKIFTSENEEECLKVEIQYIKEYGTFHKVKGIKRGPLLNLTLGGEGTSGYTLSEETKEKMSKAKKGKSLPKWSDESKEKLSKTNMGKKGFWEGKNLSEKTKENMSKSHLGKNKGPISEKRRLAIIEGMKKY